MTKPKIRFKNNGEYVGAVGKWLTIQDLNANNEFARANNNDINFLDYANMDAVIHQEFSILDRLSYEQGQIFDIELSNSTSYVTISEACGSYYNVTLSKGEFGQLINELTDILNKMHN